MLAQSPNTIADGDVAPLEPADPVKARRFRRPRSQRLGIGGWAAMIWLGIVFFGAVLIPIFLHSNPNSNALAGHSSQGFLKVWSHPLGFDRDGNDMLLNLAKGARNSMLVAIGAIGFGFIVGGGLGLIAGYFKRGVDNGITTGFNVLLAIPPFVLALSLITVFATTAIDSTGNQHPPSSLHRLLILIFALGVVSIPLLGRITRANALQWSQREFVLAARAQGASHIRVMLREVLPNVLPAMFSIALLGIAVTIVAEGGLSILGVGVLPPAVSWGNMIAISRADLETLPFELFEPIACIFLTVLSLNYLGDIVRARFDVRGSAL
ncbi:MAG: ABC transporter permease [Acidimicrobiia bacterium]